MIKLSHSSFSSLHTTYPPPNVFLLSTYLPTYLPGKEPIYINKGPYVFNRYYKRVNVQFQDDGKTVTFSEKYLSEYNADASGEGLSLIDEIQLINPAWHQVVSM